MTVFTAKNIALFAQRKMSRKQLRKSKKFDGMILSNRKKIIQYLTAKSIAIQPEWSDLLIISEAKKYLNFNGGPTDLGAPRRIHKAYCALIVYIQSSQPEFVFDGKRSKATPTGQAAQMQIDRFYASYEWRKLRYTVLQKYGFKCLACGRTPAEQAVMHVDHIKPLRKNWHLRLDANNLQVLCDWCNHGKGNWDETDYRPPE